MPVFGHDLDQAASGVQRIVVSEIPIGEKHVAGHFAGQLGMLLLHLGFDQRMAGLVHDRVAAQPLQLVVQELRAFHFADERRARLARQNLAPVDQQQHVAVDHFAVFIHRADAVRIAIERDAQIGLLRPHGVLQVFRFAGTVGSG